MMKTCLVLLTVVLAATSANRSLAQGNVVVNGGFDTDASGWSVNNGSSFFDGKNGNPPGSFYLTDAPSPSSDPTISQMINGLVPSTVYVASGDYRFMFDSGLGSPTDLSFGVAIDGVFLFEAANPQDIDWHSFSFLYTATAPSVVLSISAQRNDTGVAYAIDNIAIQVPEPSSAGLFWLGAAACAIFVGKHRRF